ncbi:MAG: DUF167 domain-containing protein [Holosporales bacterium]|jgi:uncharacterized protein (TIGR00251 family)|nr:DUF167 domain-containing protein [Holosporales bacterium]
MLKTAFSEADGGIEFYVRLTPGSKVEAIHEFVVENQQLTLLMGPQQNRRENALFKISVHAKPTDNQANIALVKLISEQFETAKSNVSIVSGMKSRVKRVCISGYRLEDVPQRIAAIVAAA